MNPRQIASSRHCSLCGGSVEGYKCPECGAERPKHDPDHWRNCPGGGKFKLKCRGCGRAETACRC